jgi:hypothetical protein
MSTAAFLVLPAAAARAGRVAYDLRAPGRLLSSRASFRHGFEDRSPQVGVGRQRIRKQTAYRAGEFLERRFSLSLFAGSRFLEVGLRELLRAEERQNGQSCGAFVRQLAEQVFFPGLGQPVMSGRKTTAKSKRRRQSWPTGHHGMRNRAAAHCAIDGDLLLLHGQVSNRMRPCSR